MNKLLSLALISLAVAATFVACDKTPGLPTTPTPVENKYYHIKLDYGRKQIDINNHADDVREVATLTGVVQLTGLYVQRVDQMHYSATFEQAIPDSENSTLYGIWVDDWARWDGYTGVVAEYIILTVVETGANLQLANIQVNRDPLNPTPNQGQIAYFRLKKDGTLANN